MACWGAGACLADDIGLGKTVLAIAHRLSTVHGADRICVIDKGQIVYTSGIEELKANDNIRQRYLAL